MISKSFFDLLHQGASIQRWNDHLRPHKGFTEMDKQAHKMFYVYILQKYEEEHAIDRRLLIEGCIFEYLHRIFLTDIKPPVFHKLMDEKGDQINHWVLDELRDVCQGLPEGFYQRFEQYLLDKEYGAYEKKLIGAAHYLATAWEFDIVYSLSHSLYGVTEVKSQIEAEIAQYFDLAGVKRYYGDYNTKNFLNLVGQLRVQERWTRCYRVPETSVIGHMLIVAILSYLFSLELGACDQRCYNNFFGGLFHDLPEVLTRDIVSPVKRSVEGLEDIIKDIEHRAIEGKIFPLLPQEWHREIQYYVCDEFDCKIQQGQQVKKVTAEELHEKYNQDSFCPIDGELIRGCDHLSAFLEVYLSKRHGVFSMPLQEGWSKLFVQYKDRKIEGIDFGAYFRMFYED